MQHETKRALEAASQPEAWHLLWRDYDDARARMERQDTIPAPFGNWPAMDAFQEVVDQVATDHADALTAMLAHPAPDAAALRCKIEAFHRHDLADGWERAAQIVAQLANDARRLLN